MALNPLRDALRNAGLSAFGQDASFQPEADAALGRFRAMRESLERQVRRGDLTVKVARDRSTAAARELRESLDKKASGHSPAARVFVDRLSDAARARAKAKENLSLEGLQRETNRLLRQGLIEQQLAARQGEFEGRAFVRSFSGGPAVPNLQTLLDFHETSRIAGDEPAMEWGRRQLESFRSRVVNPDDHAKIDQACDRPDQVNPRVVARYMEALRDRDSADLESFVGQATDSRDANACAAAFLLAREQPEGASVRWVRDVLNGVDRFPDAALSSLRVWEADTRQAEIDSAKSHASFAGAIAEAEARLSGLEPPDSAALARQARVFSKPIAAPGEPIGLTLDRRGSPRDEFDASLAREV